MLAIPGHATLAPGDRSGGGDAARSDDAIFGAFLRASNSRIGQASSGVGADPEG